MINVKSILFRAQPPPPVLSKLFLVSMLHHFSFTKAYPGEIVRLGTLFVISFIILVSYPLCV